VTVSGAWNSPSFRKHAFRFFGRPFLIAIAMSCFVLLFWHFRLGSSSPGLPILARANLPYWGSVFLILFFLLPSAAALFVIRKLAKKSGRHGIAWYEYLDLPEEEPDKWEGKGGQT
jgi:hypothetical protein